jgi:hypothetical protein
MASCFRVVFRIKVPRLDDPGRLVCRRISRGKTSPVYHSEKTYDISELYVCVRHRHVDEFWNAKWRAFVTTVGTCWSPGRRPFLNGGLLAYATRP